MSGFGDYEPLVNRLDKPVIRTFDTGATRDIDNNKYDYEGFVSPLVLQRFAEYMHKHRTQKDGTIRDADNWQKGMPLESYMKSGYRHFMDWWKGHRGLYKDGQYFEDALCAIMFNAMGYLLTLLTKRGYVARKESGEEDYKTQLPNWVDYNIKVGSIQPMNDWCHFSTAVRKDSSDNQGDGFKG